MQLVQHDNEGEHVNNELQLSSVDDNPPLTGLLGKSSSVTFPTGTDDTACSGVGLLNGSTSDQRTGSEVHRKTPSRTGIIGKSSTLIFLTGVDNCIDTVSGSSGSNANSKSATAATNQARKESIRLAIEQCENCRGFPFSKKKLLLSNLKMYSTDIPLSLLCKTQLSDTLYKLDLSNNVQLGSIPPLLVQSLPSLQILDLSQCSLNALPDKWDFPALTKLDLSHNRLDFPEENVFAGLPELQELRMYGNTVKVIIVPTNPKVLSKLETLDLGYNDLVCLPLELDQLKSLRTLRVMNNFLDKVPARICEMDLKTIDVSSNPLIEPPIETCERGICVMRRYWKCIRLEEQAKMRAALKNAHLLTLSGSIVASQPSATSIGIGSTSIEAPILSSQQVRNDDMSNIVQRATLGRSTSDLSTGSFIYCKAPSSSGIIGKSATLIFPTGVDKFTGTVDGNSGGNATNNSAAAAEATTANQAKKASIHLVIDQCENSRGFLFRKKKLILSNLKMFSSDIPLSLLCKTQLGNTLYKLDLSNNVQLGSIPPLLVQSLPSLRILNLSQCSLNALPDKWVLPKLRTLDLSHNRLDFPEESIFAGLPELQELRMYGNTVKVIIVPTNPKVLSKLETLDLGYNDLVCLPLELDRFKSLRTLQVMNNFLDKVPARICEMDLKTIDVSSNPITEPPIDACERGICAMRRYWKSVHLEEQTKIKAALKKSQLVSLSATATKSHCSASKSTEEEMKKNENRFGTKLQCLFLCACVYFSKYFFKYMIFKKECERGEIIKHSNRH